VDKLIAPTNFPQQSTVGSKIKKFSIVPWKEVEFVEHAFLQGQARRGQSVSPLIHSDRGSQYASAAFGERLAAWGCRQSMSRKGNCWDNAVTESFFSVLKGKMVHHERFATRQEARDKIFDYIEVFYNRSRIHSATDYFAPAEYEVRYRAQLKEAA
jgi:putative transposase